MASINYAARQISVKIVYYGPGLSGKTTNLQVIHKKTPQEHKSDMVSLATETDRTLFFDFLPLDLGKIKQFDTKFQLYTVPGQVYYNATRKLVLRGVDGVVFVADSGADKIQENLESFQNLEDNLAEYGYQRDSIPIIIQYNKRDLPNALPIDELNRHVNKYNLPHSEGIAYKGVGVFDTLKLIGKIVIDHLNKKYSRGGAARPAAAAPAAPPPAAPVYQPPQQQAWEQPAPAYQPPQQQYAPPPPPAYQPPQQQAWEQPAPAYQPPQQQYAPPPPAYQPPQQQAWEQPTPAYQPPQQAWEQPAPAYQPPPQQQYAAAAPSINTDPFAMPQTAPAMPSFEIQSAPSFETHAAHVPSFEIQTPQAPAPDPFYAQPIQQFDRPTVAQPTVPDNPFLTAAHAPAPAHGIPSFEMAPMPAAPAPPPPPAPAPQQPIDYDDMFIIEPKAQPQQPHMGPPPGTPVPNQGGFQQSPFEFEMPSPPTPMAGTQDYNAPTGGGSGFNTEGFSNPAAVQAAPAAQDLAFDYKPFAPPAQAQDFSIQPAAAADYGAITPMAAPAAADYGMPQAVMPAAGYSAPQAAAAPAPQPGFEPAAPVTATEYSAAAPASFGAPVLGWGTPEPFQQPAAPPAPAQSGKSELDLEIEKYQRELEARQHNVTATGAWPASQEVQPYPDPGEQSRYQAPLQPQHSAFSDFEAELEGRTNKQDFNENEEYPSDSAMFFTSVDRNTAMLKKTGKPPVNPAKKAAAQQQKTSIMSKLLKK